MKFCAVVCEYGPFHNGHAYQFSEIRKAGYEHILCIMSGNFSQRGEAAPLDKFTRARHAVLAGADAVLELPALFSVAPAEIFAEGAMHILSSVRGVEALAFGCESGDREGFLSAAKAVSSEDRAFKALLKENMRDGTSYIRARNAALLSLHPDLDESLLSSPNNILGVEYCRTLYRLGSPILPLPIPRVGGGYSDPAMHREYSSASAIRAALREGDRTARKRVRKNVPPFVYGDLEWAAESPYREAFLCALVAASEEQIAATTDCAEGLENRLKIMARSNPRYDDLLKKTATKRYTVSRIKRILAQNFLGLEKKQARACLLEPLYCRVLAVRRECADEVLSSLSAPVVVRKSDCDGLKKEARECLALDLRAGELYAALTGKFVNEFQNPVVE